MTCSTRRSNCPFCQQTQIAWPHWWLITSCPRCLRLLVRLPSIKTGRLDLVRVFDDVIQFPIVPLFAASTITLYLRDISPITFIRIIACMMLIIGPLQIIEGAAATRTSIGRKGKWIIARPSPAGVTFTILLGIASTLFGAQGLLISQ